MKKLETYMMAAIISVGISGIMAIPSQAGCRTILIGNDYFTGWNDASCRQPTENLHNSCKSLESLLSGPYGLSSYCPNPYRNNYCFNDNFNCGFTQNCGDDEEYFPGQDPGEIQPGENNKPEQNKPEENKPGQNIPEQNIPEQNIPEENNTTSAYVKQVIRLVNEERAKAGLSPLTESASVDEAAAIRAKETTQSFSHTRPDGSSFSTVLRQHGISFTSAGENIAYGQRTPQEVMNTWMNSSGHRANILNSSYTTIGVGCYQTSGGTLYWTQLFTR